MGSNLELWFLGGGMGEEESEKETSTWRTGTLCPLAHTVEMFGQHQFSSQTCTQSLMLRALRPTHDRLVLLAVAVISHNRSWPKCTDKTSTLTLHLTCYTN